MQHLHTFCVICHEHSTRMKRRGIMVRKTAYSLAIVTFFIFCLMWVNLNHTLVQNIDRIAVDWFKDNSFLAIFHYFGEPWFVVTVGIIIMAVLWLRMRDYRLMLFLLATFGGGAALNQILKNIIERPRPERIEQLMSYSFPSGHSMSGMIYLLATVYIVTKYINFERREWMVWLGAFILAILIGISRVAESRHFGSDVIAGLSLGFTWFMLCVYWYELRENAIKHTT